MGKLRLCLPMMILLVLAGCGRLPVSPAEQQALQARGKYLEMTVWSARAQITADYGQRVYTFSVTASGDAEQTLLVLTAPETVAGMATRMGAEGTVLEELPLEVYQQYSDLFTEEVYKAIDLNTCVSTRISEGGTSVASVEKQIAYVKDKLN